jgi:transcriptional regulator with XRE-family HTH domain
MQGQNHLLNLLFLNPGYDPLMAQSFGHRLAELRRSAGLSQNDLARTLGEPQSNVSFWERSDKPPRGEVLPALAKALRISVDQLLGLSVPRPKPPAAKGRLQKVFEAASALPRRQQEKIAEFVEAFVAQHSNHHSS